MNTNGDTFFSTSDLSLATVLSLQFPIEKIDKQNPRKAQFLFSRTSDLEQLVESYWRGELKLDPKVFAAQQKSLKTRLYSEDFDTGRRQG